MRSTLGRAAMVVGLCCAPIVRAEFGPWEPSPQKVSLLVIGTHPDDEHVFFGGVLPYYTKVKHLKVAAADMVTDYTDFAPTDVRGRKNELRNAVWHSGVRLAPVFGEFKDSSFVPGGVFSLQGAWDAWDGDLTNGPADLDNNGVPDGREAGARFIARQIRQFQPEIVVSHDLAGEYGHGAHQATAQASVDAFTLAADPSVDIDGLPAWGARKLYLHMYGQNKLFHTGWETPRPELDGETCRQVADESVHCHVSQGQTDVSTFYRTGEFYDGYDSERWGLYASRVGLDPAPPATPPEPGLPTDGYGFGDFLAHVPNPADDTFRRGDANGDGAVNFDDLLLLAQQYGQPTTPDETNVADFNLDGVVNFADLLDVAQHYTSEGVTLHGHDRRAAFAEDWALAQALVPEPTVGLGVGAVALLAGVRKSRRPRRG